MINLAEELRGVRSAVIAGHVRPDGDAAGSCLGLYHYLRKNFPEIDAKVYLEKLPDAYQIIPGVDEICHDFSGNKGCDLFFCLDCADEQRLGKADDFRRTAGKVICIDHHISNQGFGDIDYIVPDASSTSELVFTILEEEKIPFESAEALYMGIIHDTGVFRHSCTSPRTLEIAASLMRRGIDCPRITNETYYDKSYRQNRILGKALMDSVLLKDGKVIYSRVDMKTMERFGTDASDLDGIVQQLMSTKGTEAAVFLYETGPEEYKVSLRSKSCVDVSRVARLFGGGGHVRASGYNAKGDPQRITEELMQCLDGALAGVEESD